MIRVCGVRFLTANAHIWWLRSKLMNGQKKKKNETTEACCSEIGIWMNEAVMNDHSIEKKEKEAARKKSRLNTSKAHLLFEKWMFLKVKVNKWFWYISRVKHTIYRRSDGISTLEPNTHREKKRERRKGCRKMNALQSEPSNLYKNECCLILTSGAKLSPPSRLRTAGSTNRIPFIEMRPRSRRFYQSK